MQPSLRRQFVVDLCHILLCLRDWRSLLQARQAVLFSVSPIESQGRDVAGRSQKTQRNAARKKGPGRVGDGEGCELSRFRSTVTSAMIGILGRRSQGEVWGLQRATNTRVQIVYTVLHTRERRKRGRTNKGHSQVAYSCSREFGQGARHKGMTGRALNITLEVLVSMNKQNRE